MTTDATVKNLAEEARRIGNQHAAQASAWEKQVEAKAELLALVIEAIKPALSAISTPVAIRGWPGARVETGPFKGAQVAGGREITGRALYLNDQGVFVEVDYVYGPIKWDQARGPAPSWEGKWCPLTVRHVVTEYQVEAIIDRLAALLAAQAKGLAPKRTAALEERTALIQAVVTLLRGAL